MKTLWSAVLLGVASAFAHLPAMAAEQPPDLAIRATTEQLRGQIKAHHVAYEADPAAFYKMVDEVIVPRFDIPYIGRLVLGRAWRSASEQQRTRFIGAFKNSLVHSYAGALLKYHDTVKEEWQPLRLTPGATDTTVRVDLLRENAPPLSLGFEMHKVGGEWKVYDVSVEGLSLATNFRAQFGAEIQKNGLDAVIARLEGGGRPLLDKPAASGG